VRRPARDGSDELAGGLIMMPGTWQPRLRAITREDVATSGAT
jgi:hypothetical protein